jgi:outer membrane protein assembly factor BamB
VTEAAGASVPHVVTTDDVVVAVEDEEAVGLAPADGAVLWRRPFEGSLSGHDRRPTTVADGTLFLPVETEETPRLLAVDTANGAVRWRADVGPAGGVPVVARGVVYHSTAERLLALDATDGSVRWEFSDGGDAEGLGTPVVGTGGLYVAGLDAVYALAEGPA